MARVLEVSRLTRSFGDVHAVREISFGVDEGSIFGFIGPNGAGKTTTMRILATLDHPSSGEAYVQGLSVIDDPDKVRGRVGFMPDHYGTYPSTTVDDYLEFFGRAYGLRGRRLRDTLESLIDFTEMGGIRGKMVDTLSKGMKQRLALARTLVHDPELLVLDEPAAGLDPRARIAFRELLKVLAERGKAILISSHILTELAEIVDSCAIIERGALLYEGKLETVRRKIEDQNHQSRLLLEIELLQEEPGAELRLRELPFVGTVRSEGRRLHVDFEGDRQAASELLRTLVTSGMSIISFKPQQVNLEDVFMAVTKGEVQ